MILSLSFRFSLDSSAGVNSQGYSGDVTMEGLEPPPGVTVQLTDVTTPGRVQTPKWRGAALLGRVFPGQNPGDASPS